MKIVVLHNAISEDALPDDLDTLVEVKETETALLDSGYSVSRLTYDPDKEDSLKKSIEATGADVVFNLVESVRGKSSLMYLAAEFLEKCGVKYTGAGLSTQIKLTDKLFVKSELHNISLPTPAWFCDNSVADKDPGFPCRMILKSRTEHASAGIDSNSVVFVCSENHAISLLNEKFAQNENEYYLENYIDGREINIAIIGADSGCIILPPSEIIFKDFPSNKPKIVDYKAKWITESFEYANTVRNLDFTDNDTHLLNELKRLAYLCWKKFDMEGYARVDFRIDEQNNPFILEINVNPCISSDSGFTASAKKAGYQYPEMATAIIKETLQRKKAKNYPSL